MSESCRVRNAQLVDRSGQHVAVGFAPQCAGLEQALGPFFDEQRHAVGLRHHRLEHLERQGASAGNVLRDRDHRIRVRAAAGQAPRTRASPGRRYRNGAETSSAATTATPPPRASAGRGNRVSKGRPSADPRCRNTRARRVARHRPAALTAGTGCARAVRWHLRREVRSGRLHRWQAGRPGSEERLPHVEVALLAASLSSRSSLWLSSSSGRSPARLVTASTTGESGVVSAVGEQLHCSQRSFRSSTVRRNSCTSRDLPTPASPETDTACRPRPARSSAALSCASSFDRPWKAESPRPSVMSKRLRNGLGLTAR